METNNPQVVMIPVRKRTTPGGKATCVKCVFRYIDEERDPRCHFRFRVDGYWVDAMDQSNLNRPGLLCPVYSPTEKAL